MNIQEILTRELLAERAKANGHIPPMADDDDHVWQSPAAALEHSTWLPVDLADALAGVDVPAPVHLTRTDGIPLLYAGRTHGFAGESETCKSWVAQIASAQVIKGGGDVLWIDFEDDDRGVVSRLLAMSVPIPVISERFVYVRPEEPLRTRAGAWTAGGVDFDTVLASRPWALIVIDGVTEAMVTEGLDLNSNSDIATWSRLLPKRCANTGAAVAMLDHVPKSTDNRGRYAIGGQHKLAGLTGCQYVFEVERPFSRATFEPVVGVIKITVTKDRPGHVRTFARDGVIARMELTSYPDGAVRAELLAPNDSTAPLDLILAGRIAGHLAVYPKSSKNSIEKTVKGHNDTIRETIQLMVVAGWLVVEQRGQSHLHTLTDTGIEYFDV
jgi:hypothetical protein